MIDQAQITKLRDYLLNTSDWAIFLPKTEDADLLLSALAFDRFLHAALPDKNSYLYAPALLLPQSATLQQLLAGQNFRQSLAKDNLIISFPYRSEQVEQIYSQIDEGQKQFFITIKPQKGVEPVEQQKLQFSYSANTSDLLFLFGVNQLSDLQQLYHEQETLFQDRRKFLISINDFLPDFGNLDLDISGSSSYCESVFYLLKSLSALLELDFTLLVQQAPIANQLLYGIESKTAALQTKNASANTFLAVAELLQNGAERLYTAAPRQADRVADKNKKNKVKTLTANAANSRPRAAK